ncbi:MAG TPA: hypothetical protein VNI52_11085 [Sphingobacteriaceae bacterium]|nr:hypothetical protein [Sphingobacteriaceae bacterium]
MKKVILLILLGYVISATPSQAQININVNLGSQPQWGPSGYNYAEYYYLPDIETYYYVPKKQFVYLNNGRWAFTPGLPSKYSGYDLYNGYKVVLNTPRPYLSFTNHKVKYGKFKGLKAQQKTLKSTPPVQAKKTSSVKNSNRIQIDKGNIKVEGASKIKHESVPEKGEKNKGKGKGKD